VGLDNFWKDVARLEALVGAGVLARGHAVALTNDSAYWNVGRQGTADAAFRLHEGHQTGGVLAWGPGASTGTT
jgi:hypothetical protein